MTNQIKLKSRGESISNEIAQSDPRTLNRWTKQSFSTPDFQIKMFKNSKNRRESGCWHKHTYTNERRKKYRRIDGRIHNQLEFDFIFFGLCLSSPLHMFFVPTFVQPPNESEKEPKQKIRCLIRLCVVCVTDRVAVWAGATWMRNSIERESHAVCTVSARINWIKSQMFKIWYMNA